MIPVAFLAYFLATPSCLPDSDPITTVAPRVLTIHRAALITELGQKPLQIDLGELDPLTFTDHSLRIILHSDDTLPMLVRSLHPAYNIAIIRYADGPQDKEGDGLPPRVILPGTDVALVVTFIDKYAHSDLREIVTLFEDQAPYYLGTYDRRCAFEIVGKFKPTVRFQEPSVIIPATGDRRAVVTLDMDGRLWQKLAGYPVSLGASDARLKTSSLTVSEERSDIPGWVRLRCEVTVLQETDIPKSDTPSTNYVYLRFVLDPKVPISLSRCVNGLFLPIKISPAVP